MKAPNLDKQMKRAINPLEFIHVPTKLGACDAEYLETAGQFKYKKGDCTNIFTLASEETSARHW